MGKVRVLVDITPDNKVPVGSIMRILDRPKEYPLVPEYDHATLTILPAT